MVAVALGGSLLLGIVVWASWYLNAAHSITRTVEDAHLPYVEVVDYTIDITLNETVVIYLTPDVTDAQVADLYCRIVTPAAASGLRTFAMQKGVQWVSFSPAAGGGQYPSGGTDVELPACP